jgi:uncharacterized damage-inducible protein DinB
MSDTQQAGTRQTGARQTGARQTGTRQVLTGERADLAETLAKHRALLRQTTRGITDEEAALRTTVSALSLAGIIKHVSQVERGWARFIVEGPSDSDVTNDEASIKAYQDGFRMLPGETLAGLLADYQAVEAETDKMLMTLVDLDAAHPLPEAPWFPPGTSWTARRVLLHVIAETAQHAGHADIIREALDGAKTMG